MRPVSKYQRNFITWGDHSSVLSAGVLVYTVEVIYCQKIFYTDNEMLQSTWKLTDVQSTVEQLKIYIFAHCPDTISEKLSCVIFTREDILSMKRNIKIEKIELEDTMRFFQGFFTKILNIQSLCVHKLKKQKNNV